LVYALTIQYYLLFMLNNRRILIGRKVSMAILMYFKLRSHRAIAMVVIDHE
jgi:hypothetical protein